MPIPLLIDCDPGIDDALALLLALGSPALDVQAVTCVAGNRPLAQTVVNARRVLDLAGAHGIPVHAGCTRPLAFGEARSNLVHGDDGLGGVVLPLAGAVAAGHAADVLRQRLEDAPPGTLHVVALGPLTNLALAEIRSPGLLKRAARLDIMGGAAFCVGNVTPHAEFNFHADPLAADVVLDSGAAIRLFGLDVTDQAMMSRDWIEALGALPGRAAQAAQAMLRAYAGHDLLLHDACPVAALVEPALFRGAPHRMRVEWRDPQTEGRLIAEPAADDPAASALITGVDNEGLMKLVARALRGLG